MEISELQSVGKKKGGCAASCRKHQVPIEEAQHHEFKAYKVGNRKVVLDEEIELAASGNASIFLLDLAGEEERAQADQVQLRILSIVKSYLQSTSGI